MKKLIIALFSIITFGLNAQVAIPFTPFTGFYNNVRVLANKAYFKQYTKFEVLKESQITYKHSKDGLNDTIYYDNGYIDFISYYPDGKMKSYKNSVRYNPHKYNIEEYYNYDNQERILEIKTPVSIQHFYYTNTGIDSIIRMDYNKIQNKYVPAYKDIVLYFENGYKYRSYQYIIEENRYTDNPKQSEMFFDEEGRITEVIGENSTDLEEKYIYSENGYTHIAYRYSIPYSKNDYCFNENGYLIKESLYFWVANDQYWSLDFTAEYDYSYEPTAHEHIEMQSDRIYSSNGSIVIESNNTSIAEIYSITGILIKRFKLEPGVIQIPVGRGFYIVSMNNRSIKIKVNR